MNLQTMYTMTALTGLHLSLMCTRLEEKQLSLNSNLAQVVIGVRRSGKSTICGKFLRQNNVDFAYANFDDDRLSNLKAEDFDRVLDALYQIEYGTMKKVELHSLHTAENYYSHLKEAYLLLGVPKFSYKSRERVRFVYH